MSIEVKFQDWAEANLAANVLEHNARQLREVNGWNTAAECELIAQRIRAAIKRSEEEALKAALAAK